MARDFYLKTPTPPGGSRPGDLIGLCTPTETPQGDEEEATEKVRRGLMGRGKNRHSSGVKEYSSTASRRKDEGDCPVVEHKRRVVREKGKRGKQHFPQNLERAEELLSEGGNAVGG